MIKNSKGVSYIESILSVVILFTITAIIIPIQQHLEKTLHEKVIGVRVSEVAYNGALSKKYYNFNTGEIEVEGIHYFWTYTKGQICVQYEMYGQVNERCVNQNGLT